jgi:hypothetical protein
VSRGRRKYRWRDNRWPGASRLSRYRLGRTPPCRRRLPPGRAVLNGRARPGGRQRTSRRQRARPPPAACPAPAARRARSPNAAVVAGPAYDPVARQSSGCRGGACRVAGAYTGGATIGGRARRDCRATGWGGRGRTTRPWRSTRVEPRIGPAPCHAGRASLLGPPRGVGRRVDGELIREISWRIDGATKRRECGCSPILPSCPCALRG